MSVQMNGQASKPIKNLNQLIPLAVIGAGLIILGLLAVVILASDNYSGDLSVVPSEVNFPAPDLTLNDLQGEKVSISEYRQQIVLINNWATWCPPCKAEDRKSVV